MSTNCDEDYKKTIKDAEKKDSEPRVVKPSSQTLPPTIGVRIPRYSRKTLVCPDCGNIGRTTSITKGSFLIKVVLWLMFLIPRVLHSIWRLSAGTTLTQFQRR